MTAAEKGYGRCGPILRVAGCWHTSRSPLSRRCKKQQRATDQAPVVVDVDQSAQHHDRGKQGDWAAAAVLEEPLEEHWSQPDRSARRHSEHDSETREEAESCRTTDGALRAAVITRTPPDYRARLPWRDRSRTTRATAGATSQGKHSAPDAPTAIKVAGNYGRLRLSRAREPISQVRMPARRTPSRRGEAWLVSRAPSGVEGAALIHRCERSNGRAGRRGGASRNQDRGPRRHGQPARALSRTSNLLQPELARTPA